VAQPSPARGAWQRTSPHQSVIKLPLAALVAGDEQHRLAGLVEDEQEADGA